MKIAIPTADYPPIEGGISTVTVQVSRELAKRGHVVTVIAPRFDGMDEFDANEPVHVVRYRGYNWGWLRYFPMARAAMPRLRDADRVIAINVAYGGLMARRSKTPYVVLAYGFEFLKFRRNPAIRKLLLSAYRAANNVIAISSFTRDALIEFGTDPAKIETILPGASPLPPANEYDRDRARSHLDLEQAPVILAVGRFVARKGHETLIRAMPQVLEPFPQALLVLVGRGPRLAAARQLANELGVTEHVRFPSCVSDAELEDYYRACDVFALPAGEGPRGQVEGFGLVFTEAHAHGKPVVAGRSGGVVDAVLDGETGILVEPENPDAVAAALIQILKEPELARRLGENGRRRVESELNWERFTARLAELLESAE